MENIGLQDSLLSRFDLLFVMLDTINPDHDRMISEHVVRMHRYRNPKEQDGDVLPMGGTAVDMLSTFASDDLDDENKETPVYEKYDALLHGISRSKKDIYLSVQFMKKYIHLAKCLKPKLTEPACEAISNEYSRLRSQEAVEQHIARTQPITPRTLETLIRLSTAHAKARMGKSVTVVDAHHAIELVQYAYFKRVLEKEKKKRRRGDDDYNSDSEEEENDENISENGTQRTKKIRTEPTPVTVDYASDEEMPIQVEDAGDLTRRTTRRSMLAPVDTEETPVVVVEPPVVIAEDRLIIFRTGVHKAFRDARTETLSFEKLKDFVNKENENEIFSQGEIDSAVIRMTDDNQIMVADGIVFLV